MIYPLSVNTCWSRTAVCTWKQLFTDILLVSGGFWQITVVTPSCRGDPVIKGRKGSTVVTVCDHRVWWFLQDSSPYRDYFFLFFVDLQSLGKW